MVIARSTYITGANNKGGFISLFPTWQCPVEAQSYCSLWGLACSNLLERVRVIGAGELPVLWGRPRLLVIGPLGCRSLAAGNVV